MVADLEARGAVRMSGDTGRVQGDGDGQEHADCVLPATAEGRGDMPVGTSAVPGAASQPADTVRA